MYYVSTRDAGRRLTASQAIVEGLSRDGGLYLPEEIPQLTMDEIKALAALSYPERAAKLMKRYLDEFTEEELLGFAKSAYGPAKFDTPAAAPVVRLTENTYIQELWHGPTCAFKDMALQMLPYLLTASLRKTGEEKTVCILVATSGDTGKAALEGFRDVDRTKILVFYPDGGVSEMQKLQMVTQEGKNVGVCAVRGNFDDAQTGVKRIFSDEALREELPVLGQLHQLGQAPAADRVLRLGLLRPAERWDHRSRDARQFLRPDRQLRQHSLRLLREEDGRAHRQAHLRVERE